MLYCDYTSYVANGGKMTEEQYTIWGDKASRKIDCLTLGRAEKYAANLADELASACTQMADIMLQQASYNQFGSGLSISGATNDGYAETYIDAPTASAGYRHTLYEVLSDALGVDPYGLLYKGICQC